MAENGKSMVISTKWLGAAILTFVVGFSILGVLAYRVYDESPPIPMEVVSEEGQILFTGADIMAGQHIFQKYGLMQHGTIFGHGAYLGPDFTAQYLHRAGLLMVDFHRQNGRSESEAIAAVQQEFKQNRYDPQSERLILTPSQVAAFEKLTRVLRELLHRRLMSKAA